MPDISYFEAWGMWMDGKSTLGNNLFGLPMIWWGRGGKIVSFVSGLVVVLDIVGVDRVKEFAASLPRLGDKAIVVMAALAYFAMVVPIAVVSWSKGGLGAWPTLLWSLVVGFGISTGMVAAPHAFRVAGRLLGHGRFAPAVRVAALLLFMVGFHFDLLAS